MTTEDELYRALELEYEVKHDRKPIGIPRQTLYYRASKALQKQASRRVRETHKAPRSILGVLVKGTIDYLLNDREEDRR